MNFKIILGMLVLLAFIGGVDAVVTASADPWAFKHDNNDVIDYGDVVQWDLNVSSTNNYTDISSVSINGIDMVAESNGDTANWSNYQLNSTLNALLGTAFGDNCSVDVVATVVDTDDTYTFSNTTSVGVPCILVSDDSAASLTITDKNTTALTLTNLAASVTNLTMALGGSFNASTRKCNYGCTNAYACQVKEMVINTTEGPLNACNVTVTRIATDTGVVSIDLDESIDTTSPSNIPATVVGLGVLTLLAATIVQRVRSRGGTR